MKKMFTVMFVISMAFAAACGGKKAAPAGPGSDMGSAAGSGEMGGSATEGGGTEGGGTEGGAAPEGGETPPSM